MKFTDSELIFIHTIMEEKYKEYENGKTEELKFKQYEEAELSQKLMNNAKDIIDKIENTLMIYKI